MIHKCCVCEKVSRQSADFKIHIRRGVDPGKKTCDACAKGSAICSTHYMHIRTLQAISHKSHFGIENSRTGNDSLQIKLNYIIFCSKSAILSFPKIAYLPLPVY